MELHDLVREYVHGRRRRIALRKVLACLLLLVLFVVTAGTTVWSWNALQHRQVELGGGGDRRTEVDGRSLTGDLVKREGRALEAAPARKQSGSAVLERPAAGLPEQSGGTVSLDGRLVAGAVTTVGLLVATVLSRLVLRRIREEVLAPAPLQPPSRLEPELWASPGPEGLDPAATLPEPLEEAPVPSPPPDASEPPSPAALLVEQRQPPSEESFHIPDWESGARTLVQLSPSPHESATRSVPLTGRVDTNSHGGPRLEIGRERIFDRRASRRLSYVQPARLWWSEQNAPVTVQDVSLTGLRCLLVISPGAPELESPRLGRSVRIVFPVSDTEVTAAAQLRWKEQTSSGMEMGLEFVDLPEAAAALILQLLLFDG